MPGRRMTRRYPAAVREFDLIIIGAGSGNSIIGPQHDRWNIAMVERGKFGGTCMNVGCIPSKMFVYSALLAELAGHGPALGVHTSFNGADWPAIRDRVFGRIDPIAEAGANYRQSLDNVTVYRDSARFVGPHQVDVGGEVITANKIVLAAGARPMIPDVPGLDDVGYHTSDTIMRLDELPERLIVIGGGYIATELGNVFGSLGSQVTFVVRGEALLRHEDDDVSVRFTEAYSRKFDVRCLTRVRSARRDHGEICLTVEHNGEQSEICGDQLLVATGRIPNSDDLNVAACGVEVDQSGYVPTDSGMRTNVPGVWALGDITNPAQLKHVANYEARVVAHNITTPDSPIEIDGRPVPHAVFGHPQVASVGLTERECREQGLQHVSHIQNFGSAAYGWAMEDTQSFVKLVADPATRLLLGVHIIGPQASTLIQQLVQGMTLGQTIDQMAHDQYWIHPALPEVLEQALLEI